MSLRIIWLYFEEGIPSMDQIQKQFRKQTGLKVLLSADFHFVEVPKNTKEAIHYLHQDIDRYEQHLNRNFRGDLEAKENDKSRINYMDDLTFYCYNFYELKFRIIDNIIELEFLVSQYYFPASLSKALYDLGGRYVDSRGEQVEGYYSSKRIKKLKWWEDYRWYNRPKR
ncbi:MAG: hypothetical protein AAFQ83_16400 [Bacteroidota bacterium]